MRKNPKLIWLVSDNGKKLFFRTQKLANDFRKKENRKIPTPVPYEAGQGENYICVSFEDGIKIVDKSDNYYFPRNSIRRYIDRTEWRNRSGQFHRTDGPAVEWANGIKEWWQNGQRHRVDGPAVEYADGYKEWWQNNCRHRIDGPAIERPDGSKEWWQNGQRHRTGGPVVERADGSKEWWQNGLLHRTDGPAIEWPSGTKEWWQNNQRHRTEGPAIEYLNGYKQYWKNNRYIKSCTPRTISYVKNKDTENEEEMELELCCKECAKFYYNFSDEEFKNVSLF